MKMKIIPPLDRLAHAAQKGFSGMPTLYKPGDTITTWLEKDQYPFLDYASARCPEEVQALGRTGYSIRFTRELDSVMAAKVFVHPKYRGRGYGRELVEAKERLLRSLGFDKSMVRLTFPQAQPLQSAPFWEHLGYREHNGILIKDL